MVERLPACSCNQLIAADNLFNSIETSKKVEVQGHCSCWALWANAGIPKTIKDFSETLKETGNIAVVMAQENNISIYNWHDSKVVFEIPNVHGLITRLSLQALPA